MPCTDLGIWLYSWLPNVMSVTGFSDDYHYSLIQKQKSVANDAATDFGQYFANLPTKSVGYKLPALGKICLIFIRPRQ